MVEGIRIIDNILEVPGVDTLEGRIGTLLKAARGACHYIHMQPGMFVGEHPHPTESIIYTVSGKWVLCSQGQRWVMNAGALYWFGENVPTGYETPFNEGANLLIFKPYPREGSEEDFQRAIQKVAAMLQEQRKKGTPFLFSELPANHPAIIFARQHGAAF